MRALMLSVVEQRASLWGALTVGASAAAAHQVPAANDEHGVFATGVDGNLPGDQKLDNTSYDLPPVSMFDSV